MMVARPLFAAALCLFLPCFLTARAEQASGTASGKKYVIQISGTFPDDKTASGCPEKGNYCIVLTNAVGVDITPGDIKAYRSTDAIVTISYTLPDDSKPVYVYMGQQQPDQRYLLAQEDAQDPRRRGLLLSGDFCHVQSDQKCAYDLLKDNRPDGFASSPYIEGYVSGPGGIGKTMITINQISKSLVDVSFLADSDFGPTVLVLKRHDGRSYSFPYRAAPPDIATDVVYLAENLEAVCTKNDQKPCEGDGKINLKPFLPSSFQTVTLLSREKNLLFTHIESQAGDLPEVLTVELPLAGDKPPAHLLARRVTKPANDQSLLSVEMTVMDQETVRKNFGAGIAEHYLAVNLDAANRTEKKLQFNKSAIWFDVDYQESSAKYKLRASQKISIATLDLYPANVYLEPFSTECNGTKKDQISTKVPPANGTNTGYISCEVYRFGIEQNKRVYPDSYTSVLNSFDYATEKTDRILRYVELYGSILNTIAGGGYVAQVNNFAFRDAISIFTGNFLPGVRALTQDTPGTNRLRANLVNETFQETVQLPPNGHGSTVVLLPRDAILAIKQDNGLRPDQHMVVIRRVLNVHIDPDVLNGVKDANIPANYVEVGYSKEQVRQSLGEPSQVKTNDDGTSVFTYSSGAYQTINFNKDGHVVLWDPRSTTQQIVAASTLDAVLAILKANNLPFERLTLLNGNTILVDVAGITDALQYDISLKHLNTNYKLRYIDIRSLKGKKESEFETTLGQMKLPQAATSYSPVSPPAAATKQLSYPMPDIKGGIITVTFNGLVKTSNPDITTIEFGGEKPSSVVSIQP